MIDIEKNGYEVLKTLVNAKYKTFQVEEHSPIKLYKIDIQQSEGSLDY